MHSSISFADACLLLSERAGCVFPSESKGRINALFSGSLVSPGRKAAVNLPFDAVPAWIPASRTGESLIDRRVFPVISSDQTNRYPAASVDVAASVVGPVMVVDWSDLNKRRRHFLLRASVPVQGHCLTLKEEVHTLKGKEKPSGL